MPRKPLSPDDREELTRLLRTMKTTLSAMAESDPAPEIDWPDDADLPAAEAEEAQAL